MFPFPFILIAVWELAFSFLIFTSSGKISDIYIDYLNHNSAVMMVLMHSFYTSATKGHSCLYANEKLNE